jgi:ABC-2 type transport system ATP-binding protein
MLMGLATPTQGQISILGMAMPGQALDIRARIGLVPDDSLLFDHLTGLEFVEFSGRMYKLDRDVARARAAELITLFELDGSKKKIIGQYSKGMRKRVAMAAALIHRPDLFLLDEPFEGVDAVGARLMKDILIEQVRRGATIFLTSHVLEVVERLCERVAIINEGRLVVDAPMAELRSGQETLEDIFVRVVGGVERNTEALDWL